MMLEFIKMRKYTDAKKIKHLEIRLLGMKMRIPLSSWYSYFQTKRNTSRARKLAREVIQRDLPGFLRSKNAWLSREEKREKRRLFITSGNFHLINVLSIIDTLKEQDDLPVENHVIVWSIETNKPFEDLNYKIAKSFGVTHYHACCGPYWEINRVAQYLIEQKLYAVDEIYSLQRPIHLNVYNMLYQGVEHIITDESYFTLVPSPEIIATQCKKFVTTCYLGKLDYADFPGRSWSVEHLPKHVFDRVARRCEQMYPFPSLIHPDSKPIVFCGTCDAVLNESIAERQEHIVQSLIDRGYLVLYKPHPRDATLPRESAQLKILHTRLPLECYRMDGVLAVVSLYSSASTQSYHYSQIPGFIDYQALETEPLEYISILAQQYTPPVERLLDIDTASLNAHELKKRINDIYVSHLNDKPLMSQNELFTKSFHNALQN